MLAPVVILLRLASIVISLAWNSVLLVRSSPLHWSHLHVNRQIRFTNNSFSTMLTWQYGIGSA